jgi:hypothetical protein
MVSKASAETKENATVATLDQIPLEVVKSFENIADVQEYFASLGVEISSGEEITDGYEKLENKDRLLDTPIVLIDWSEFQSKEYGATATSVRIMTFAGEKFRIADGSTGIFRQLEEISNVRVKAGHKTPTQGLIVRGGLRKSEYWVSTVDGRALTEEEAEQTPKELKKKATTYYLNL